MHHDITTAIAKDYNLSNFYLYNIHSMCRRPKCNKVLNVIIFCPKCNKLLSYQLQQLFEYAQSSNKRRVWDSLRSRRLEVVGTRKNGRSTLDFIKLDKKKTNIKYNNFSGLPFDMQLLKGIKISQYLFRLCNPLTHQAR